MLLQKNFFLVVSCCLCLFGSINCSLEEDLHELIEDNFDQWIQEYFLWLTEEQVAELRDMKAEGYTIDDFLPSLNDMYDALKGKDLGKATEGLNRACLAFIDHLTESSQTYISEFENIARSGYEPYTVAQNRTFVERTRKRLAETADHLVSNIKDRRRQQLARKFLPSCVKVFLTSTYMIRYYNDHREQETYFIQDSDVEKWSNEYLHWLNETEKGKLKKLLDEGASFHELRVAIGDFYTQSEENRLIQATQALYSGCNAFASYLFGEEATTQYLEFFEDTAGVRQELAMEAADSTISAEFEKDYQENLHKMSNALIEEVPPGFKKDIVRNYFVTCVAIFDRAFRMKIRVVSDRDEL